MIQQILNTITTLLLAKFLLNDIPHTANLFGCSKNDEFELPLLIESLEEQETSPHLYEEVPWEEIDPEIIWLIKKLQGLGFPSYFWSCQGHLDEEGLVDNAQVSFHFPSIDLLRRYIKEYAAVLQTSPIKREFGIALEKEYDSGYTVTVSAFQEQVGSRIFYSSGIIISFVGAGYPHNWSEERNKHFMRLVGVLEKIRL